MLAQIKRVIWPRNHSTQTSDEHYAIHLAQTEKYGEISIRGSLRELRKGEWIDILRSSYEPNTKFGPTLRVLDFKRAIPDHRHATPEVTAKWLSTRIPGVGPKTAEQIVAEVGIDSLLENPQVLVDYVPARYKNQALDAWAAVNDGLHLDTLLESVGIVGKRREVMISQLGGAQATLTVLRDDPWSLGSRFPALSFPTLDKLASILQLDMNHPSRMSAGTLHTLIQMHQDSGDTMIITKMLVNRAARDLGIPAENADERIIPAIQGNPEITELGRFVATTNLFNAEQTINRSVLSLNEMGGLGIDRRLVDSIAQDAKLDAVQRSALHTMNDHAISALTGGPGTGKTTTLGAFVRLCQTAGQRLVLVAPTGKAARRLSEVADYPASTIHRWLIMVENGNAPETDMVVIDESSMIPSTLMARALRAVISECGRCVLVGDPNQLPPVEAGAPFRDILRNEAVNIVKLEKIWRQQGSSMIPIVCQAITKGMMPSQITEIGKESKGWRLLECDTPEQVEREAAIECIRQHKLYGLDGSVVLSPHYNHAGGVNSLSRILQQVLNPNPVKKYRGEKGEFRVGDPVLHVGNVYIDGRPDLTHAMMGHVVDIRKSDGLPYLCVEWEDDKRRWHACPNGDAGRVLLGYALSYHRSQGSEYQGVVVVMAGLHNAKNADEIILGALNREAVYTGISRAKKEVVVVAEKGVMSKALGVVGADRRTALYYGLKHAMEERRYRMAA